jgi:hypothetical protein
MEQFLAYKEGSKPLDPDDFPILGALLCDDSVRGRIFQLASSVVEPKEYELDGLKLWINGAHVEQDRLRYRMMWDPSFAWCVNQEKNIEEQARMVSLLDSTLAPIRKIPNELLEEVMLWTVDFPADMDEDGFVAASMSQVASSSHGYGKVASPHLLSQVCRRWRMVAEGYSALWTHINIHIPSTGKPLEALNSLVRTLVLSNAKPLHVRL